jgi:hypothetical protein
MFDLASAGWSGHRIAKSIGVHRTVAYRWQRNGIIKLHHYLALSALHREAIRPAACLADAPRLAAFVPPPA